MNPFDTFHFKYNCEIACPKCEMRKLVLSATERSILIVCNGCKTQHFYRRLENI